MHQDVKKILVTEEQIVARASEIAKMIDQDYQNVDGCPLLVGILKGSVPFMSELMKHITRDIEIDFMAVSSYSGTESLGDIKIIKDLDNSIQGRDILIVEDIVDTGITLFRLKEMLYQKGARNVKTACLLNKPSRREKEVEVEYIGFDIENEFVIGYGLDYNQKYRNLPYVGVLKDELY